jgi:hypothetical protein
MTWVQVRFWLFVCVWVVVLILVFPRSGEWETRHGRLSCAAPAVHPVSGVSVVAPLLRVEVAESPAEKPDFAHDVEGYMPARVSLGGHVLENSGRSFCRHLEIYLQRLCVPLELTAEMVHPAEGWCVLGMQGNRLRLRAPDGGVYVYVFSVLPQDTEVVYSGELREGRLSVFQYETELYSNAYALDDSEEGLRNMYRIYRTPALQMEILGRLGLSVMAGIAGLVLCARWLPRRRIRG